MTIETRTNKAVDKSENNALNAVYRARVIDHIATALKIGPERLNRDDIILVWQNRGIKREHLDKVVARMVKRRIRPTDVLQYIENDPIVRDLGVPELERLTRGERLKLAADLRATRDLAASVGSLARSRAAIAKLHADPNVLAARDQMLADLAALDNDERVA